MKFIHTADIHLGVKPDAGSLYTENRGREIWDSLEELVGVCEREKTDLLLIAGDVFHRQPLLKELRELDSIFCRLSHTQVVMMAGNHDYIKPNSYYRTYQWKGPVTMFLTQKMKYVEFEELKTCVYGLSYCSREITEPLYDTIPAGGHQPIEILLAHGGDEKHIPFKRSKLRNLGYRYVALGHIHRPGEIEKNKIYYAGSLEPTDKNDIGVHGYISGTIEGNKVDVRFVPFAKREYVHMEVPVSREMTGHDVKLAVSEAIKNRGVKNIYKIILTGVRDPEMMYDEQSFDVYGNILEVVDRTIPEYDYEHLKAANEENLIGKYIESFQTGQGGDIEELALFEGVRALLETKRG